MIGLCGAVWQPPWVYDSVYFDEVTLLEAAPLAFLCVEIGLQAVVGLSAGALCLGHSVAHERAECLTQCAVYFLEVELYDAL